MRRWVGRISMRYLATMLLAIAAIMIAYSFLRINAVQDCMATQSQIELRRKTYERQSQALCDASDDLTESAWRFIAIGDSESLNHYWTEVCSEQSRERAVRALRQQPLTQEEQALLDTAKRTSDALIQGETWAMRLVAEGLGLDQEDMPDAVAAFELPAGQSGLSAPMKKKLAVDYIFGRDYMDRKQEIRQSLSRLQALLSQRTGAELEDAFERTRRALKAAQAALIAVLAVLSLICLILYALVLIPFLYYCETLSRGISLDQPRLRPCGASEMRLFARVFNRLYDQWKAQNEQLARLSATDFLTGIPNRQTLFDYVEREIRQGRGALGVMMVDIDNFKAVNDSYGHQAGDQVLIQIARCLSECVPAGGGLAARLGGEEFVLALSNASPGAVDRLAQRIQDQLCQLNDRQELLPCAKTRVTVSMGSVLWTREGDTSPRQLIHLADLALYRAKANGKNQHKTYTAEMSAPAP